MAHKQKGMNEPKEEQQLSTTLGVRVTQKDMERLDALVARMPIIPSSAIARAALRLGLDVLEKDPAKILTVDATPTGRRKAKQ